MGVTQYIGSRYVPVFADPAEWNNTRTYEPLTIVLHEGNSFTSKQYVPAGVDINNEEFWAETGNYNSQVELYRREVVEVKEQYDSIFKRSTSPFDFGAKGDGVTYDTEAIKKCFEYASSNKIAVVLNGAFKIGNLSLDLSNPIVVYGSVGSIPSTIAASDVIPNIILDNATLSITNITCINFNNVAFKGSGKGIVLQSFRNSFNNCAFTGFTTAISVEQGMKWGGENRVNNSLFHNCALCINLLAYSDGMIIGNIADSTCGSFIKGGADSGYLIQQNHCYGSGASEFTGYNTVIENNYWDKFGKIIITGNGGFVINGNTFLGAAPSERTFAIKFTSNNVNGGVINGNNVVCGTLGTKYPVTFIENSNVSYFNQVTVEGNNTDNCDTVMSKVELYTYMPLAEFENGYATLQNASNFTELKYFTGNTLLGYFTYEGSMTIADLIRSQSRVASVVNILKITTNSSTRTEIQFGRTVSINDYAAVTKVEGLTIGIPINHNLGKLSA